ncbi:hypothetical protein ACCI51_14025 [Microbulbifer echini]|uniref:Uncharacterized protein n=1 Tax=Microbulbifer echini TaxID=1529067 RepID=A0ABV4NR52_9GAMM|nr:hypothetical protein [uncultured Microbulbifer sp.]
MNTTVFVHSTAMGKNNIDQLKRRIDITNAGHHSRHVRFVQPKPTDVRPTHHNDWPPFEGDAA